MGVASFRERPPPASLTAGICCGDQAQVCHPLSGMLEARQVAEFGPHGHGHGDLHPTQALQGRDHRLQSPGFALLLPRLVQAVEACRGLITRADVCLDDDLWRGGGTDHFGEPLQMGRDPGGPAGRADIVAEQNGVEAALASRKLTRAWHRGAAYPSEVIMSMPGGKHSVGIWSRRRSSCHNLTSPRAHKSCCPRGDCRAQTNLGRHASVVDYPVIRQSLTRDRAHYAGNPAMLLITARSGHECGRLDLVQHLAQRSAFVELSLSGFSCCQSIWQQQAG
jgi:hypothetical protein